MVIDDRRKYPRIETEGVAELILPGEECLLVDMFDVSPDGLQVRFGKELAVRLKPSIEQLINRKKGQIEIMFSLSFEEKEHSLAAICRPIYVHRIEKDRYAMGMKFTDADKQGRRTLKRFIEISMETL